MESEYASFHRKEWPGTDVIEVGSVLPDPRRSAHPTSLKRKVQKKLRESPGPTDRDVFLPPNLKQKKSNKSIFKKAHQKQKLGQPMAPQVVTLGDSPSDEMNAPGYWDGSLSRHRPSGCLTDQPLGSAQLKKKKRKRKRKRKTKKYSKRSRTKKSRNKKYKPKNKSRRKGK